MDEARTPTERYAAAFSPPALHNLLTDQGVQDRTLDSHHHPATSAAPARQGVMMVKGGTELLQDPVAQELLASRIPARLAYTWNDGTPRVVSIWFHWNGSDIVMGTLPGAPKLKALQSGDRVALTIDTNDPPHHILSIRGTAEVTEIQGVVTEYAQAAVRYLGKEQGEAYVGSLPPDIRMGRIAVRPDQVVVLDFETRFPTAVSSLGSA
jgi:translation initiation factor IF-1